MCRRCRTMRPLYSFGSLFVLAKKRNTGRFRGVLVRVYNVKHKLHINRLSWFALRGLGISVLALYLYLAALHPAIVCQSMGEVLVDRF